MKNKHYLRLVEDSELRQHLQEELQSLPFHAFEQCIRHLLKEMGYSEVELLGRVHRRQFTTHGGLDMQARSRLGVTETPVILQLKQYSRAVSRRFVDELRGTMLRLGAGQGLIITTGAFSKVARLVAAQNPLVPVRLIDGKELIDLLIVNRIGIRSKKNNGGRLDKRFFQRLRRQFPARTSSAGSSSPSTAAYSTSHVNPQKINNSGDHMLWKTHVVAGIGSLWLLSVVPGSLTTDNIAPLVGLAAFGAMLPDLDAVESKIKHLSFAKIQPFAPLSSLMHQTFGHRGRLHSLAGLAVATATSLPLAFWWGWQAPLALSLGYSSHLLLDACTRTGIPILKPNQRLHLLPKGLRIATGSLAEEAIFPLLALVVLILLLRFLPGL